MTATAVAVAALERAAQQLLGEQRPSVGELADAFERGRRKRAVDVGERGARAAGRSRRRRAAPARSCPQLRVRARRARARAPLPCRLRRRDTSQETSPARPRAVARGSAADRSYRRRPSAESSSTTSRPVLLRARDLRERRGDRREAARLLVAVAGAFARRDVPCRRSAPSDVERFDDRRIRRVCVLAHRRDDRAHLRARDRDELGDQAALADAGFAADAR